MTYSLGRLPEFDERSRDYPARALAGDAALATKTWRRGNAYDQGQTPMCVAYAGKGILCTSPNADIAPARTYSVTHFYNGAQRFDEYPGTDYDGTSALGLGKYLLHRGLITEYRWCFGLDDVLATLSTTGPVGIGVKWKSTMWATDADGYLDVSGTEVGGHEVELLGVNVEQQYVTGCNSWGTAWGINGRFRLRFDDLAALLDDDGDAVVLVR